MLAGKSPRKGRTKGIGEKETGGGLTGRKEGRDPSAGI